MAWRDVRRRHKLLFRFDPDSDSIEVIVNGQIEVIQLDDYRPLHRRRKVRQPTVREHKIDIIGQTDHPC